MSYALRSSSKTAGGHTFLTERVGTLCTPTSFGLVGELSFFFMIERMFCFCTQTHVDKALTHLVGYINPGQMADY